MKKVFHNFIEIFILTIFVGSLALGIWFLSGGDLKELINGCYSSQGC